MTIEEAYEACREIARREAKNFYYAFRVLPRAKSDAMCAVYAFMRRADDISDDESVSIAERTGRMATWLAAWVASRDGAGGQVASGDPVFVALRDTQKRFGITDALLAELVEGTTMDLRLGDTGLVAMQTYATFEDLYKYCYLVASVVGLVCIRIFGYKDPVAEKYAEETGIGFQLTNILRDVKEDTERNRLYLPLDLLAHHGVQPERWMELSKGAALRREERDSILDLAGRAEAYYASSRMLLPLIDADSRAALWVLVEIYHRLLVRIVRADGDVFKQRIKVPTAEKMWVLCLGTAMSLKNRMVSSS